MSAELIVTCPQHAARPSFKHYCLCLSLSLSLPLSHSHHHKEIAFCCLTPLIVNLLAISCSQCRPDRRPHTATLPQPTRTPDLQCSLISNHKHSSLSESHAGEREKHGGEDATNFKRPAGEKPCCHPVATLSLSCWAHVTNISVEGNGNCNVWLFWGHFSHNCNQMIKSILKITRQYQIWRRP